ncbi:hypothetical protein CHS0354_039448 [Potamilus streckersoni]|uniref:Secreted protein n=1 Tax=Potamilus streckersoni TaxID=2493646 RepID=A0AAE0S1Z7_9BIVA|nr:hypothetical protein CHS0354_039448 [Potamilus streckersoni]
MGIRSSKSHEIFCLQLVFTFVCFQISVQEGQCGCTNELLIFWCYVNCDHHTWLNPASVGFKERYVKNEKSFCTCLVLTELCGEFVLGSMKKLIKFGVKRLKVKVTD